MQTLPEAPVRRVVGAIHRHPYLVFFIGLAFAVLSGLLAGGMLVPGTKLGLKSKIQDLLPGSSPSVQASELLKKRLGSADILVVTLMTDQFDQVKEALPMLASRLEALPDVREVRFKNDVKMLRQNALIIFPTLAELQDYYKDLTTQIRDAVKKEMQLFDEEEETGVKADGKAKVDTTLAWAEIETDDGLSEIGRTFRRKAGQYKEYFYNASYTTIGLKVYPTQSSSDLAFSRKILEDVEGELTKALTERFGGVGEGKVVTRIDLGGGYRNAIEQMSQIQGDMVSSAGISFAILALIVIVFFRSIRALFCVMVPLILGTAWTLGFATLAIGYVNIITAFIFAVLLGLGIDFGIHFYGRYREERAAGHDPLESMVITHQHCGMASVLAGTTTAFAFLALTLADFRGFSQFGLIAAVGVVLCMAAVFFIFTALTFAFERWSPLKLMGYSVNRGEDGDIVRSRFPFGRKMVFLGVMLGVGGVAMGPLAVEFELDFNKLGPKQKKGKAAHEKIQYGTTEATAPAVIFTGSADESRSIWAQLEKKTENGRMRHPRIKSYQTLMSLVPDQQAEKKKWVRKLCRKLKRKVKLFEGDPREGADELLAHCEPEEFGADDLPDWIRAKFTDKSGRMGEFIFVSPRGSTNDGEVALAFREEMMSLEGADGRPPVVSGKPMVWAEVLIAMKEDGALTSGAAFLVVLCLLMLFERKIGPVGIIFMPLGIGVGITVAVMAITGMKLNFFNMLALPTIIGMGVDDGVHMYHRYKELGPGSAKYIVSTTGMAAVLTTLTTSVGFASLMVADNRGLNSLGMLTVIGMVSALFTTLVILPAALQWRDDRRAKKAAA